MTALTDEELLRELKRARDYAHNAPKDPTSSAWARHGREYLRLLADAKKRGIGDTDPPRTKDRSVG